MHVRRHPSRESRVWSLTMEKGVSSRTRARYGVGSCFDFLGVCPCRSGRPNDLGRSSRDLWAIGIHAEVGGEEA